MADLPIIQPGQSGEQLASELERFSFGAAVSPLAEVTPFEGPDAFVQTAVTLGGISVLHAQHPETMQQNLVLTGKEVPERIAGHHFMFDTQARLLMAWIEGNAGPIPTPDQITSEVAGTMKTFNDTFDQQS